MGEYFTKVNPASEDGYETIWKAGTCEDWRYTRCKEAEEWAPFDAGKGTDVRWALAAPIVLWRFPWPDEDNQSILMGTVKDRDMFRTEWLSKCVVPAEVNHKQIVQHIKPRGAASGINIWIPCPKSPEFNLKTSFNGADDQVNIVGIRYDEQGRERTIFGCAWCDAWFCAPEEFINLYRLYLEKQAAYAEMGQAAWPADWYRKVAERLRPVPVGAEV